MVLGYHRVTNDVNHLLAFRVGTTNVSDFSGQLAYLKSLGCRFVSLDDALTSKRGTDVVVTFDDGFRDIYDSALPILEALRVPFTLFLISATIGARNLIWQHEIYSLLEACSPERRIELLRFIVKPHVDPLAELPLSEGELISLLIRQVGPREIADVLECLRAHVIGISVPASSLYLTAEEVKKLLSAGMNLEAHGHEHWVLTTLSENQLKHEVIECGRVIELLSGRKPRFYAVAHGHVDEAVLQEIRGLGFDFIIDGSHGLGVDLDIRLIRRIWPKGDQVEFSWLITRVCLSSAIKCVSAKLRFS